ncbi:MAG: hypothetical protein F4X40_01985 [Chloroflexi bacterium]|nr:hypothetical protein [Chloroflexota bacterium]
MNTRSMKLNVISAFTVAVGSAIAVLLFTATHVETAVAQTPEPVGSISSVAPSTPNLTLAVGDTVVLSINVYGRQDVEDSSLASDVSINWSASGGTLPSDAEGTTVSYTAPSEPGSYTVTALPSSECIGKASECTATFRITVRRQGEATGPGAPPLNPDGDIPTVLTDSDGAQYAVITPEDGGTFSGEGFWIEAPVGIVPNGEIIGVRMHHVGDASNAGMTQHRYTLGGRKYAISAVDASGTAVDSYELEGPAMVCVPMPPELRSNLPSVSLVSVDENGDTQLKAITAWVRITPYLAVCGNLSVLPATIAASIPGSPPPLPTAIPEPAPSLPPTGGTVSASSTAFGWALLIGLALISAAVIAVALSRRDRSQIEVRCG